MPVARLYGPVPTDLPCMTCGYNLRTISAESFCPECGTAVDASIFFHRQRAISFRLLAIAAILFSAGAALGAMGGGIRYYGAERIQLANVDVAFFAQALAVLLNSAGSVLLVLSLQMKRPEKIVLWGFVLLTLVIGLGGEVYFLTIQLVPALRPKDTSPWLAAQARHGVFQAIFFSGLIIVMLWVMLIIVRRTRQRLLALLTWLFLAPALLCTLAALAELPIWFAPAKSYFHAPPGHRNALQEFVQSRLQLDVTSSHWLIAPLILLGAYWFCILFMLRIAIAQRAARTQRRT